MCAARFISVVVFLLSGICHGQLEALFVDRLKQVEFRLLDFQYPFTGIGYGVIVRKAYDAVR